MSNIKTLQTISNRVLVNLNATKKYFTKISSAIDNYNVKRDKEELLNIMKDYSKYLFCLIENTDLKDTIISEYNDHLKNLNKYTDKDMKVEIDKASFIRNKISSPYKHIKYKLNKDENNKLSIDYRTKQMLEQSDSNDIFTLKYKKLLLNEKKNPEAFFISAGIDSNILAHRMETEIDSIRKRMDFTNRKRGKGDFLDILKKAKNEYLTNTDYSYNYDDLKKYLDELDKENKELNPALNIDTQKAERLIRKVLPNQEINKEFMSDFAKCLKLRDNYDVFFDLKENSSKALMLYQRDIIQEYNEKGKDPYEEGKLKYNVFLVNDERRLTNGNASYRIAICKNDTYKKYSEYNDFLTPGKAYKENLSILTRNYDEYKIKDTINDISKKSKRDFVKDVYVDAFMSEGEVSVMHIDADETNSFIVRNSIKHVNVSNNPFLKQVAFKYIPYNSLNNTKKEQEFNEQILSSMQENSEKNRKKYNNKYLNFENKNDLDICIKNEFQKKEEI